MELRDIVEIVRGKNKPKIEEIENAFWHLSMKAAGIQSGLGLGLSKKQIDEIAAQLSEDIINLKKVYVQEYCLAEYAMQDATNLRNSLNDLLDKVRLYYYVFTRCGVFVGKFKPKELMLFLKIDKNSINRAIKRKMLIRGLYISKFNYFDFKPQAYLHDNFPNSEHPVWFKNRKQFVEIENFLMK